MFLKNKYLFSSIFFVILIYSIIAYLYFLDVKVCIDSCRSGFEDFKGMVRFSECYQNGVNPYFDYENGNKCFKAYPCPYIYPRFALYLPIIFGVNMSNVVLFCFIQIIIFLFFTFSFLDFKNLKSSVLNSIVLVSPAILLLLERGNFDLIIFLLIYFSFAVISIKKFELNTLLILRYLIILFVSLIKIYPILLMVFIFKENMKLKHKVLFFILFMSVFLGYNLYFLEDYEMISKYMTNPSELAFGRKVLIQEFTPLIFLNIVSIIPTVILVLLFKFKYNRFFDSFFKIKLDFSDKFHRMFLVGSTIYLFAFYTANNYDYKFVFLIFTLPFLFNSIVENKVKILFSIILIISLYASSLHRYFIPFNSYTQWFIVRNLLMVLKYLATNIIAAIFIVFLSENYLNPFILLFKRILFLNYKLKNNK